MKHNYLKIFLLLFYFAACSFAEVGLAPTDAKPDTTFPLVNEGRIASIILPPQAPEVIKIAAGCLAEDIAEVSGKKAAVLSAEAAKNVNGPRIELLLAPKNLVGKWETFQISATPEVLTIAGSDPRGLAYGIFEISRRIGVSPWHWWADVPVVSRKNILLSLGEDAVEQPAVKYRGIFINDEDWGLEPWASKTFEPEVGNIGPKTYGKIFELLLRLRGNLVWPGMHPTTRPFHTVPGNAETADRYAIIVGSSHAEPMLRTNGPEWKLPEKNFNYLTNQDDVLAYWEERVKERTSGESIFTIGMRGIHDSPIMGPKGQSERIETLEKIFKDQRDMLAKYLGNGDASKVGQMFCPYKEVLADYNAGLKVPEDVVIVWPDDNFGYIRRFGTPKEQKRAGGLGVYYHASYSGMPQSYLWVDTGSPALMWSKMMRADGKGRHIVTENGYFKKDWPRFQRDTSTPRPEPTEENVAPAAPK
ncbi:MAG: glycosyl hydrolase 115 family protein, partial [Chthoniobacterales bacterium]